MSTRSLRIVRAVIDDDDDPGGVASAAAFARHLLTKDFPAARTVFDQITSDRGELLEFATGLVSLTNAVLTAEHGRRHAEEYLETLAHLHGTPARPDPSPEAPPRAEAGRTS